MCMRVSEEITQALRTYFSSCAANDPRLLVILEGGGGWWNGAIAHKSIAGTRIRLRGRACAAIYAMNLGRTEI